VTTDGSGVANFSFTIKPALAAGLVLAATDTSPSNNTSAFSADMTVSNGPATATVPTIAVTTLTASVAPAPAASLAVSSLPFASPGKDRLLTALATELIQAKRHRAAVRSLPVIKHGATLERQHPLHTVIHLHARKRARRL
jgi:hypothetical protein